MNDQELQNLLRETHPVLPGQEARAWSRLRDNLYKPGSSPPIRSWIPSPGWGLAYLFVFGWVVVIPICDLIVAESKQPPLASADSQSPGIFATAFYSHAAKAQVVWLDGMEPITGRPTYLDPTTPSADAKPAKDPYSL